MWVEKTTFADNEVTTISVILCFIETSAFSFQWPSYSLRLIIIIILFISITILLMQISNC